VATFTQLLAAACLWLCRWCRPRPGGGGTSGLVKKAIQAPQGVIGRFVRYRYVTRGWGRNARTGTAWKGGSDAWP
jgi:hypothetical protein